MVHFERTVLHRDFEVTQNLLKFDMPTLSYVEKFPIDFVPTSGKKSLHTCNKVHPPPPLQKKC